MTITTYDIHLNNNRSIIRQTGKMVRKYLRNNRFNTKVWVIAIIKNETKSTEVTGEFIRRTK